MSILSLSQLARDPRVIRQVKSLEQSYNVTIVGYAPMPHDVKSLELSWQLTIGRKVMGGIFALLRMNGSAEKYIYDNNEDAEILDNSMPVPDVVIANDINVMPIIVRYLDRINRPDTPIYLDLHEFSPLQGGQFIDRHLKNRFKAYLCEKYLSRARVISTVSRGLVEAYERLTGRRVHLVPNAPSYAELPPLPVEKGKIRLVHHGGFGPGRDLQGLIKAVQILGKGYELHFYLIGEECLVNKLKSVAEGAPVFFHEPVSMELIAQEINQYDIGVYLLRDGNLNNKYAMPNKLYEFVQARLAIATSSNHEMKQFILKYKVGRVTAECNGTSLAQTIKEMSPDTILNYKRNSDRVARENCSEKYHGLIRSLTKKAIGQMHLSCVG